MLACHHPFLHFVNVWLQLIHHSLTLDGRYLFLHSIHLTHQLKGFHLCFPGFADGPFLGRVEGGVEKSDREG